MTVGDPDEYLELHAIFRGRVQGVGFRATVQHHAGRKGLVGTVKNLRDGTVEVYAQGSKENLEVLLEALHSDAGIAVIDGVATDYRSPRRDFASFEISF